MRLLVALYDTLDPLIRPLAIDEMGMSGRPECITKIVDLVQDDSTPGFARIKAIEAVGRLRASAASPALQKILETKQVWRWAYPHGIADRGGAGAAEDRAHAWRWRRSRRVASDRKELVLEPTDPEPNAPVIRQRRYARLKLTRHVPCGDDELAREHAAFDCGIEYGRRNRSSGPPPGARVAADAEDCLMACGTSGRKRSCAGARPQAMAFEFVDMDLDERSRLRKLLLELGGLPQPAQITNRSRRQSRMAISR